MKKLLTILAMVLTISCFCGVVSCGGDNDSSVSSSYSSSTVTDSDASNSGDDSNGGNSSNSDASDDSSDVETNEVTQNAKNSKIEAVTSYYNEITPTLDAIQKYTIDVVYNNIVKQINDFSGSVTQFETLYDKLYSSIENAVGIINSTAETINQAREKAKQELEILYGNVTKIINDVDKNIINEIYNQLKDKIEQTQTSVEEVLQIVTDFKTQTYDYLKNVITFTVDQIKTLAESQLTFLKNTANKIFNEYEDCKNKLIQYYNEKVDYIKALTDEEEIKSVFSGIINDFKGKITEIITSKISELKQEAKTKLDQLYSTATVKIEDVDIKTQLDTAYSDSISSLNEIKDIDSAKTGFSTIVTNFTTTCKNVLSIVVKNLKEQAKTKLDNLYYPAINKIDDEEIKGELTTFYTNSITRLENVTDIDSAKDSFNGIVDDFSDACKNIITEVVNNLKVQATEKLDTLKKTAIDKLTSLYNTVTGEILDVDIKSQLDNAYNDSIKSISNVTDIDSAKASLNACVANFTTACQNIYEIAINKLKEQATEKLNKLYNSATKDIDDKQIKTDLDNAYDYSINSLNEISDIDSAKQNLNNIVDNFKSTVESILKTILTNLVTKYKGDLQTIYENASKPLSDTAKQELVRIYNSAVAELETVKTKEQLSSVLATFKENAKTYILTALNNVVTKLGQTPEPWSFLPESFSSKNKTIDKNTIPTYADFTDVSSIPTNYIGKQLNVVYTVINKLESALSYVNKVYNVFNTFGEVYNTIFDNSDGQNICINVGEGEYAFVLKIKLTTENYEISADISSIKVIIFSELTSDTYGARIQLNENLVLKYSVTPDKFIMAYNILNVNATQISFEKNGSDVTGYIYETTVAKDTTLTSTSALLTVKDGYTTVVGNKGDFIPTSGGINCEVYENSTGKFVGSEVYETFNNNQYDTLWYNLTDINGISSIKKIDEANGVNPDTIYINDYSADTIHTKLVNIITNQSRRFDIEFKTVYAFVYNQETNEYESVTYEVPMMFIQEAHVDTFSSDFEEKNPNSVTTGTVSIKATDETKNAVDYGYHTLVETYKSFKDNVSYQDIIDYCNE